MCGRGLGSSKKGLKFQETQLKKLEEMSELGNAILKHFNEDSNISEGSSAMGGLLRGRSPLI